MSEPTENQIERAKERLRIAQKVLQFSLEGLTRKTMSERLGLNLNVVSFWVRALGLGPRGSGLGEGHSYVELRPPEPK